MLTTTEVVDLEMRMRGQSLGRWCSARGLLLLDVVAICEGWRPPRAEIVCDLADAIGVSPRAVRAMIAAPRSPDDARRPAAARQIYLRRGPPVRL